MSVEVQIAPCTATSRSFTPASMASKNNWTASKAELDRFGQRFWSLTRFILDDRARFDDAALAFDLERPPRAEIATGHYHLIS
ncbi:MAG: hypothetical protein A3H35_16315 [Betaproteobacteria bacterium RIFCSPLOWO2_02_FULL_62_17]|nr:MAG: hypothetical protein A3H35_16315 [Betaproteobacteria bacterium RIFCSPLOWO2_02_FULL_62_17]